MSKDDTARNDDDEKAKKDDSTRRLVEELALELKDELGDIVALGLGVRHLPAVPSVREVKTLLECAEVEARDYLMLRLLYYTGVRTGELVGMVYADLSADEGTIFVRDSKGSRDRYVCVDPNTVKLIQRQRGDLPLSHSIVDASDSHVNEVADKYGKRAGLVQKYEAMMRSWSPNSLRHAFATHRYDAGMDLAVLQKLLGHEYLQTTLIYVETSMRHLRKQYRRTDPLRERQPKK